MLKDIMSDRIQTSEKKAERYRQNCRPKEISGTPSATNDVDLRQSALPAPAKTYLAVATALAALREGRVSRIILTRPAVEAGEALGFLPG